MGPAVSAPRQAGDPVGPCADAPMTGQGPGTCDLQSGVTIAEETELYECQDRGWPLKPWMVGYVKHQQDKTCPDCFGQLPEGEGWTAGPDDDEGS